MKLNNYNELCEYVRECLIKKYGEKDYYESIDMTEIVNDLLTDADPGNDTENTSLFWLDSENQELLDGAYIVEFDDGNGCFSYAIEG